MLKLKTGFISAVLAVAVAVTMAMSVAADNIDNWAQPYTLGTKIDNMITDSYNGNTYSFALGAKTSITVNIVMFGASNSWGRDAGYKLLDSMGSIVQPLNYKSTSYIDSDSFDRIDEAEAVIKYYNLAPGKYYFALTSSLDGNRNFSLTITPENNAAQQLTPQPSQPAPPPIQPSFVAGSVAPNVTATQSATAINVNWGAVNSARYAVYYIHKNNATGTFGDWTVKAVDTNSYTITNPVKGATYYITILPYSDTPSRVYGGFSPYAQVRT